MPVEDSSTVVIAISETRFFSWGEGDDSIMYPRNPFKSALRVPHFRSDPESDMKPNRVPGYKNKEGKGSETDGKMKQPSWLPHFSISFEYQSIQRQYII